MRTPETAQPDRAEVYSFAERHREFEVAKISGRISSGWDEVEGSNPAWDRAVKDYAADIYEQRMAERRAKQEDSK